MGVLLGNQTPGEQTSTLDNSIRYQTKTENCLTMKSLKILCFILVVASIECYNTNRRSRNDYRWNAIGIGGSGYNPGRNGGNSGYNNGRPGSNSNGNGGFNPGSDNGGYGNSGYNNGRPGSNNGNNGFNSGSNNNGGYGNGGHNPGSGNSNGWQNGNQGWNSGR